MAIIMKRFHINNIRLRDKLLIVYFLSVFLPIILTNVVFYHTTTNNVRSQKMHDLSLSLQQIANEFRANVDDAVGASSSLYTNNRIYTLLDRKYDNKLEYILEHNSIFRDINLYVPLYSTIQSIDLYTSNDTILYAGGIYLIDDELKKSKWYRATEEKRRSYPVLIRTEGTSGKLDTFSVIRELDHRTFNSTQKIIKTDLNFSIIQRIFNNVTFEGEVYLVNDLGYIEYTTDPKVRWAEQTYHIDYIETPDDAIVFEEVYKIHYLDNWRVIGIVSEGEILEEVKNSRGLILLMTLGNFVIPSVIIILLTSNLHIRLSRIVKHMRKIEDQNFELIDGIEYHDEIGTLTNAFNRMAKRIKNLINDVYVAGIQKRDLELQQKKTQLSALQSQINPHFLFNVLETIRMRSYMKQEYETAHIIQNMARLLRNSYTWHKDWVTVDDEVKLIKSYLEIQDYRFSDKLSYILDVEEAVKDCLIPNMIFIPFVENACIHGIEPLKGHGKVSIKIDRLNDHLQFIIKDNGVGMSQEDYERIIDSLEREEDIKDNVGIKNVYYRLKLYYRDQFKFDLNSSEANGTTIKILIPYQREEIKL